MPKIIKKILEIIINTLVVIFGIIVLISIFFKINMIINKTDYVSFFGYSVFSVATGSMSPKINENDIILVKKANNYALDDIVTFKKGDDYITHRIVEANSKGFVTKGDANNTEDNPITKDVIIGKVVKTFPNLGLWQKIFTTPKIYVSILITLLLFDFAFSYKGKKEPEVSKKISDNNEEELLKKAVSYENLRKEEKEDTVEDYTIRLDLNKLQEEIDDKLKNEEK